MLTLLACLLCQVTPPNSPTLEAFVESSIAARTLYIDDEIAETENLIKLKKGKGRELAVLKKRLAAAKAEKTKPTFPPKPAQIFISNKPGEVGTFNYDIVNGRIAARSCKILQVVSKTELLCLSENKKPFVVKGIDTTGKADDEYYEFEGLWEIKGTATYENLIGAQKTVKVVSPWAHTAEFEKLTPSDRDRFIKPATKKK